MMNMIVSVLHQHLHPFAVESVMIPEHLWIPYNRMVCTGLGIISVSFMTLPLIGAHSRLNVVFILRTSGTSRGTSIYVTSLTQGPNMVFLSVCFI